MPNIGLLGQSPFLGLNIPQQSLQTSKVFTDLVKLFELLEETIIRTAFEYCEHNQVQTARLLDISRNVLRHKLGLYGMLLGSGAKFVSLSDNH